MKILKVLSVMAVAILAVSCLEGGKYESNYTSWCTLEFSDANSYGADSIYFESNINDGNAMTFLRKVDGSDLFTGGFLLSIRKDTTYQANHFKSKYSVADTTGARGTNGFAVFYQNRDKTQMPDHDAQFAYSTSGTITPVAVYVANTNYMVNLMKFGTVDCPAFQAGDYLSLKITAHSSTSDAGKSASIDLARYDATAGLTVKTDWALWDLTSLGAFTYLDFELVSNRTDIPLYCCVDEFVAKVALSS